MLVNEKSVVTIDGLMKAIGQYRITTPSGLFYGQLVLHYQDGNFVLFDIRETRKLSEILKKEVKPPIK